MSSLRNDTPAITVRNLGKRFLARKRPKGEDGRPQRQFRLPGRRKPGDYNWALRHVDFDVRRGEIFGVVGRNGSGKTTLLRVLAGVTAPTAGQAEIRGRVAALLGVGTGFHPLLTGRDNIILGGTILGLSNEQIRTRFDQIVEFSEIGDYLDQPLRRYSAGMGARLAFSVSAFLDAEIMLVDEVLAVGDTAFSEKASAHMTEMLKDGRSVVYVGHSMATVRRLCDRALVLDSGQAAFVGSAEEAAEYYLDAFVRREPRSDEADNPTGETD